MRGPFPKLRIPVRWQATLWSLAIGIVTALVVTKYDVLETRIRHDKRSWLRESIATLDNRAYDWLFENRGAEAEGVPQVVMVVISDNAVKNITDTSDPNHRYTDVSGHPAGFPFPRSLHARLIRRLKEYGAKVVGIDLTFADEGDPKEDAAFASALKECGNVVLATRFTSSRNSNFDTNTTSESFPAAPFRDTAAGFAPVDLPLDTLEPICRRFDLSARQMSLQDIGKEEDYPCFAPLIAGFYRGIKQERLRQELHSGIFSGQPILFYPPDINSGTDDRSARICFAGYPGSSMLSYEYDQVLDGKVDPKQFQGKIVLVGVTLPDLHDIVQTPLSGEKETEKLGIENQQARQRYGVEVHAHVIHTLLSGHYYRSFPESNRYALIWLCALLMALITLRLRPLAAFVPLLLIFLGIISLMVVGFRRHTFLPPTQLYLASALSYAGQTIYFYGVENRRANETRRRFGRYVGPGVLNKVLDPDFVFGSAEQRIVSILFSDVQGFTTLVEKMDPVEAVTLLNRYLDAMVQIIFKYEGTLDKIMGDGIMAYFGAPYAVADHEEKAVLVALEMQEAMQLWRTASEEAGVPPLKIRIGIHTGQVVVGEVGAVNVPEPQVGYTVIGDAVNTAARLEPLNKEFGTEILISEAVKTRLSPHIRTEFVGELAIRGRQEGIRAYSVTGRVVSGTEGQKEGRPNAPGSPAGASLLPSSD